MDFKVTIALSAPMAFSLVAPAYAVQYLTVEEAQEIIFGKGKVFEPAHLTLTEADNSKIELESGVARADRFQRVWKVREGSGAAAGYFFVDDVVGKHEDITYALGISSDGKVVGIEILDYRENRGGEVREMEWRSQFWGKSAESPLKVGKDIQNISGATLSCMHVTEGVRRLLFLHRNAYGPV